MPSNGKMDRYREKNKDGGPWEEAEETKRGRRKINKGIVTGGKQQQQQQQLLHGWCLYVFLLPSKQCHQKGLKGVRPLVS